LGTQAFEEIAAPQCMPSFPSLISPWFDVATEIGFFKGSIFVTSNAKDFLESE
jgi:hypothetical protein